MLDAEIAQCLDFGQDLGARLLTGQTEPRADRERLWIASGLCARGPQVFDSFFQCGRRRKGGVPAVAELGDAPEGARGVAADPDRNRPARGCGPAGECIEAEELAGVRGTFVAPARTHHPDRFVTPRAAPVVGRAEGLDLSDLAGLKAPPMLMSSESAGVPVVLSAREICLPRGITQVLEPVELRMLLAHEIAHVARGDMRWLRIANVLGCLFWFAPVYPYVERRRREAGELACDDWAAARAGNPYGMARCLVQVAEWTTLRQGGVGLALTGSSPISRRVERLLDGGASRKRRVWPAVLALTLIPLAAFTPRVALGDGRGSAHAARVVEERVVLLGLPPESMPHRPPAMNTTRLPRSRL